MKKLFWLGLLLWVLPFIAQASSLCGNYDALTIGDYRINNNVWNDVAGSQCINYTLPSKNFNVNPSTHNKPTNGPPASYPFTLRGCHWGACTPNSGLPKQVSGLGSAITSWTITAPASGVYNASYDLWFNTTPTTTGQPDAHEIMVWINKRGAIQPVGSLVASNVSIAGQSWNIWMGSVVTSYVRTSNATAFSNMNLKAFVTDAYNRGRINQAWYLIAVEAGFEIWQGGQGLASTEYSVFVQ